MQPAKRHDQSILCADLATPCIVRVDFHELAAKGDVVGLRQRADALLALDPKYAPFAQHVLELAARFKMKAVRHFVASYLP